MRSVQRQPIMVVKPVSKISKPLVPSVRGNPAQHYAARFAGKEAVGKALGCGVRFTWREIEIAGRPKPGVKLSGKTEAWAEKVRAGAIDLSMSHSKGLATAVCLVADRDA